MILLLHSPWHNVQIDIIIKVAVHSTGHPLSPPGAQLLWQDDGCNVQVGCRVWQLVRTTTQLRGYCCIGRTETATQPLQIRWWWLATTQPLKTRWWWLAATQPLQIRWWWLANLMNPPTSRHIARNYKCSGDWFAFWPYPNLDTSHGNKMVMISLSYDPTHTLTHRVEIRWL